MNTHDDYNNSEQSPTYYILTEFSQPVLDRKKRREIFIKENQHAWRVTGQQHRYLREAMHISHYELAKCLGLSPSVILAFEKGQPIQRPRFVEGAYRTALTAFFYRYHYSKDSYYPRSSYPIFTVNNLVANLLNNKLMSLEEISDVVKIFNLEFKIYERDSKGMISFYDDLGLYLFSVNVKEAF